jgi:hypothetical protein
MDDLIQRCPIYWNKYSFDRRHILYVNASNSKILTVLIRIYLQSYFPLNPKVLLPFNFRRKEATEV